VQPQPPRIWEYIDGLETPDQYQAFEYYRDRDPRMRSLADTARGTGVGYAAILRWAHENFWEGRAQDYDTHRIEQRTLERTRAELVVDRNWAERRADILSNLEALALAGASQLLHDLQTRRTRLRPNELKQITDILLRFGNLANGDATEKVDTHVDMSDLSDEQLQALEFLRERRSSENDGDEDGHTEH